MILNETNKRVLAIDYGTKRVGVALSDPLCLFPSITKTITNNKDVYKCLCDLILEKNVHKIILGYPDNDNGKVSELGKEILKFKTELEKISNLKVNLWDEHLTSKMAKSRIVNTVTKRSKRRNKSLVDAHSAGIILEEFLRSIEK